MIVSRRKPWEEIVSFLTEEKILVVVCGGCSEACETGGEEGGKELVRRLTEEGKKVTGWILIDTMCNKGLIGVKLSRNISLLKNSEAILVSSCGIGVQAISALVDIPCYPADDTIYRGGFLGVWPGEERCAQCGECVLAYTGGICPITNCTKSLLNGMCGGMQDGKCEIDPEKPCGWARIYERLKEIGKLDNLRDYRSPRNFRNMEPPSSMRREIIWALENPETS